MANNNRCEERATFFDICRGGGTMKVAVAQGEGERSDDIISQGGGKPLQ